MNRLLRCQAALHARPIITLRTPGSRVPHIRSHTLAAALVDARCTAAILTATCLVWRRPPSRPQLGSWVRPFHSSLTCRASPDPGAAPNAPKARPMDTTAAAHSLLRKLHQLPWIAAALVACHPGLYAAVAISLQPDAWPCIPHHLTDKNIRQQQGAPSWHVITMCCACGATARSTFLRSPATVYMCFMQCTAIITPFLQP